MQRAYNQHWNADLKYLIGSCEFAAFSAADLRHLCSVLIDAGLHLKTVKNIIAGTLQAIWRDAQVDGAIKRSPFEDLPRKGWWPEIETPPPSPFTFEQRERICY